MRILYPKITEADDEACLKLWRHVMARAQLDAMRTITDKTETPEVLEILEAREWFKRANKDYHEVCDYADADPISTRGKTLKKVAKIEQREGA